jgi:hypothetical protein
VSAPIIQSESRRDGAKSVQNTNLNEIIHLQSLRRVVSYQAIPASDQAA